MESSVNNQSNADSLISPCKKLKLGPDDNSVRMRQHAGIKRDMSKNRLSQRASILCMCLCDSGGCCTAQDQEQGVGSVKCEIHDIVNNCSEAIVNPSQTSTSQVQGNQISNSESDEIRPCVSEMEQKDNLSSKDCIGEREPCSDTIKDEYINLDSDQTQSYTSGAELVETNELCPSKDVTNEMEHVRHIISNGVDTESNLSESNAHTSDSLLINDWSEDSIITTKTNEPGSIVEDTQASNKKEIKEDIIKDMNSQTLENCATHGPMEGSDIKDRTVNECVDDYAPDVYGSECLASVSSSCSLNNINVTLSDEFDKTVEDTEDGHVDSGYIGNSEDQQGTFVDLNDKTLKCSLEYSDDEESEDSEIELDNGEILVDDIDKEEADEIKGNEIPLGVETLTEIIPVRLKTTSGPLCASTPLVKGIARDDKDVHYIGRDNTDYPKLSSFKPQSDDTSVSDRMPRTHSQPLCSSTPVVSKPVSELGRDANVKEQGRDKYGRRNIIEDILCLESCMEEAQSISHIKHVEETETEDTNNKDVVVEVGRVKTDVAFKETRRVKRSESRKERKERKDRKRLKGTKIEKFKEYMGPGLTSNPNSENEPMNEKPKDYLKNTDVETCTLTEYKGFGLTGPLPDKPLHASTPAPAKGLSVRDTNIMQSAVELHKKQTIENPHALPKSMSYKDIIKRPAGTEGFLLHPDNKLSTLRRTNSLKNELITQRPVPLKRITSQKVIQHPSLQSRPPLYPAIISVPSDCLSGSSGQMTSGTSSALQPDDIYPCMSSVRSDKSDNCSTDRSNKSNKSNKSSKSDKPFDVHVLQSPGQLKVSAYMNFGLLTVHVVQGRQLSTKWKSTCDSFVKMCLIPDDGKKPKCKTTVIQDSNNPLYDEKFSFELNEEDHSKRLMFSVWHRDRDASVNEFLGSMSFGIRHLTNPKKEVSGWYYLLTEDIGRKKHLKVSHRQVPQLKVRHHANIPAVNKDVWGTETHHLTLNRGKNGFGFSVVEACPVRVGRVDGSSPAEVAGLHPGDIIIRLNKQNVSRSTATSVAKLVKACSSSLSLEIHRQKPITFEHLENPQNTDYVQYEMNENEYTVPDMNTIDDDDKENEMADETIYGIHPNITSLATSTPLPLLARGHRTVQTSEMRKQEAIHRLLSLELDFIDLMHAGMQRYSRPLRHCILSHSQHTVLFQNIEKLTTISEYHVKQMHDNAPSSFVSEDTDTSVASENHSFMQSIGLIYQSKVHMLCQAYDLYAKGVSRANQLVADLQKNEDFMKFIQDPHLDGNQPTIQQFVYQPVKHVRDLYKVIQDIFLNTSQDSSDYNSLKQVVEGLQECASSITNYSCERIESMSSLTSRESKTSYTSSMRSRSSTCSSRSSSSKGHSSGPSCSMQTSKSIDADVMRIQDKLVFSSNVPVFQLCQDDRHIVFSGDMFKWEGHQWVKVHMILFTDMILLTQKEADGYLRVLQEPTMLRDVMAMDAQRHHGTELVLYCQPRALSKRKLGLRAPSTEQKYAWKSLIEQRVFAVRGSMDYYSSTSDVSSSSASAIII